MISKTHLQDSQDSIYKFYIDDDDESVGYHNNKLNILCLQVIHLKSRAENIGMVSFNKV